MNFIVSIQSVNNPNLSCIFVFLAAIWRYSTPKKMTRNTHRPCGSNHKFFIEALWHRYAITSFLYELYTRVAYTGGTTLEDGHIQRFRAASYMCIRSPQLLIDNEKYVNSIKLQDFT